MATITLRHNHTQPDAAVRAALQPLLAQLQHDYNISHTWNGNVIHCHRSGASGTLTLHHHSIDIQIKLSMMLSMFEKKIRSTIEDFCQKNLP